MTDGATSLTVMKENPFMEALVIANEAKEVNCPKLAVVLRQNIQMSRGVQLAVISMCLGCRRSSSSTGLERRRKGLQHRMKNGLF